MPIPGYVLGQTLLVPMVVTNAQDLGNVLLETGDGQVHRFADAFLKSSAVALSPVSGVVADPTVPTAIGGTTGADPTDPHGTLQQPM